LRWINEFAGRLISGRHVGGPISERESGQIMANTEQLKALEKQIATIQGEADGLLTRKQQILGSITAVEGRRSKTLHALAAGDPKAAATLDTFDNEEKLSRRHIAGLDLLIAEKAAELAKLQAAREPILARVELEKFHERARAATEKAEKSFVELEQLLEAASQAFARFQGDANRAHETCGDRSEGTGYRNAVVARVDSLFSLMRLKLVNQGWRKPSPGSLPIPLEIVLPAALPPAN
jgi:chromosome segregation ATPase